MVITKSFETMRLDAVVKSVRQRLQRNSEESISEVDGAFPGGLVDDRGALIGEVTMLALDSSTHQDEAFAGSPMPKPSPRVIDANDPASVLEDAEPGMVVLSESGVKLGVVGDVCAEADGRCNALIVQYGRLTKRQKLVDGKLVDLIDDDVVMLSIDQPTFKSLPDIHD